MSRVLAMIRAGRALGIDDAALLAVIEAGEEAGSVRSANAERQARHRAKKAAEAEASVTNNVTRNGDETPAKEIPPTPPKENTTLTNVRVNSSAREADFETLRKAYPKRDGHDPRQPAWKAFQNAIKRGAVS